MRVSEVVVMLVAVVWVVVVVLHHEILRVRVDMETGTGVMWNKLQF